jgi:Restriction endonuclease
LPRKRDRGDHHLVTAREYERAMFNQLYYVFRRPQYLVIPDERALRGLLGSSRRQIDVSVYRSGEPRPAIAVECKRYGRRLNVKDVESFLGMLEDLGARRGVLVAPLGYVAAPCGASMAPRANSTA